ncbi:MAG: deoxyribodipyrimidine photo-lyase [Polyangiaceae bacterium]
MTEGPSRTLVWYRGKDVRLADHAPLTEAARSGEVIPVFVVDPYFFDPARARELPHRIQYLLDSLVALEKNLAHKGSRLFVARGRSVEVIPRLAASMNVDRVVAHRWVEPFARTRDARVRAALRVPFDLYEGETLLPPGTLRTGAGTAYSVFTPFSRAFFARVHDAEPLPAPRRLPALPADVGESEAALPTLEELGLARNDALVTAGEKAARARLDRFIERVLEGYETDRDRMDRDGTSRLSQDLKFGTISIRTVWHAVSAVSSRKSAQKFLTELVWREFSHSTLADRPELLEKPFRREFEGFPWRDDARDWDAWTTGHTGYPIVDAAARQLLGEGFVHNRARMISASFLTKHLAQSYRRGEAHYMKYLVDGDWAQNNMGWQWSSGAGCDAQPWFRIFHPVTQGERFDPDGAYVKRWVPELAAVPAKFIHHPWDAPPLDLRRWGVTLGEMYPRPIVDHKLARERFLALAKAHLGRGGQGEDQGDGDR